MPGTWATGSSRNRRRLPSSGCPHPEHLFKPRLRSSRRRARRGGCNEFGHRFLRLLRSPRSPSNREPQVRQCGDIGFSAPCCGIGRVPPHFPGKGEEEHVIRTRDSWRHKEGWLQWLLIQCCHLHALATRPRALPHGCSRCPLRPRFLARTSDILRFLVVPCGSFLFGPMVHLRDFWKTSTASADCVTVFPCQGSFFVKCCRLCK